MPAKKKIRIDDEAEASDRRAMEYDPDQDHDEVRGLRSKYRAEAEEVYSANPVDRTTDELTQLVETADGLFISVKGTAEAIIDSHILKGVTEVASSKVRAMKSGSGAFDVDEFLRKLVLFMGGRRHTEVADDEDDGDEAPVPDGELNWESIGRRAIGYSHRVPVSDFMLGPLSIEQKQRTVAKRAKLEKNKADEKKPQAITEEDITRSENETTKNVAALNKLLQEKSPVNLFKFIVNPTDFGQSVENLFYLSFLIRDGECALHTTDDGEPEIYACESPTQEEYASGLKKRQLVMELDMATWRRAIEVFNITEPVIPPRKKAATRIGNKWYG